MSDSSATQPSNGQGGAGRPGTWSRRLRQFHRWVAATFTVTVIVTFIALAQPEPILWVSYVPLLPLGLLLITGLYLFLLPHARKWRRGRRDPLAAAGSR
jgi:hypothetical protein